MLKKTYLGNIYTNMIRVILKNCVKKLINNKAMIA